MLYSREVCVVPTGAPHNPDWVFNILVEHVFVSALLINAMQPFDYPPVSLPRKEYMDRAREIWEQLQYPPLTPRQPWYGYELGDWSDRDREEAQWAVEGKYFLTGERARKERKSAKE
jgi:4-hydroxy-3-polyprenylbenzoate decarboxylase